MPLLHCVLVIEAAVGLLRQIVTLVVVGSIPVFHPQRGRCRDRLVAGQRVLVPLARVRFPLSVLMGYLTLGDVAQLARAAPCRGEGRGFESHHCRTNKLPWRNWKTQQA